MNYRWTLKLGIKKYFFCFHFTTLEVEKREREQDKLSLGQTMLHTQTSMCLFLKLFTKVVVSIFQTLKLTTVLEASFSFVLSPFFLFHYFCSVTIKQFFSIQKFLVFSQLTDWIVHTIPCLTFAWGATAAPSRSISCGTVDAVLTTTARWLVRLGRPE